MTAGIPFSSTGRISSGSRVIGASRPRRRHEPRTGARAGCLQIDLEHLELDRKSRQRDECPRHACGQGWVHRSYALDETITNAVHDVEVFALNRPVAHVSALELIGFVRREVLDRQSKLAVVL